MERESDHKGKRTQEKHVLVVGIVFMDLAYLKGVDIEAGMKGWSDVDMPVDRLFSGVFMLRTMGMF